MRSQRGQGTSAAGIPHSRLGEARRAVTQALIGRGKSVSGARSTHARHYAPLGAPRKLMMEVDKGAAVRVQGGGWGMGRGIWDVSPRLTHHLRRHYPSPRNEETS